MKKKFILVLVFLFLGLIHPATALYNNSFRAKVIEIIDSEDKTREDDNSTYTQQDIKLIALDGEYKDQEIFYYGISDIDVASASIYKVGDKVLVDESDGVFYITDFVRTNYLYLLVILFILTVVLIGRFKGFKALLGLVLSFLAIIKFILPQILAGNDPFIVSLIGCLFILAVIIYLSEGWNRKSHIAIFSVLISLIVTLILSVLFTKLTRLTGMAQEETVFLIGLGAKTINFQGLLLAGMLIGAVGVLDDIIIGQIEAVGQLREANPELKANKLFTMAYKIGNTHLGAIINTLFLTYAGAALPLLLLFIINEQSGLAWNQLLNTEVVSTEIVRTLVGSIGVILSMPIATYLASRDFAKKK